MTSPYSHLRKTYGLCYKKLTCRLAKSKGPMQIGFKTVVRFLWIKGCSQIRRKDQLIANIQKPRCWISLTTHRWPKVQIRTSWRECRRPRRVRLDSWGRITRWVSWWRLRILNTTNTYSLTAQRLPAWWTRSWSRTKTLQTLKPTITRCKERKNNNRRLNRLWKLTWISSRHRKRAIWSTVKCKDVDHQRETGTQEWLWATSWSCLVGTDTTCHSTILTS